MKRLILLFSIIVANVTLAAISIDPTSRAFDAKGGGAIISTSGDGSWTATSDAGWLTVSIASGNAGKGCAYLVSANNTADVRVGHITVAGNVYTVTQGGRSVELTPSGIEVNGEESNGEISLVTDANVSWTVRSNDEWISVLPKSGTGPATLTYVIQSFDGVGSRSGTITVGSQTVPVKQTGIDVNLTPTVTNVPYTVTLIPVIVDAMAETTWKVKPNDTWLSVVDQGTGRGGSQVMLAAAENPSFEKRTGTVSIGTGKITVIQDGTSDLSFKILPEVATASPLGAFGNVAVYATPDATWTAESLADWIHISSGAEWAGNGNVKYVVNSNPELLSRTGQIKFTPPAFVPDVDLYRGLLFWIKDQTNIEGNETRQTTYPLSKAFDGSFSNPLTGAQIPAQESDAFTLAFSFKIGELDCINRILKLGGNTVYLTAENKLSFQSMLTNFEVLSPNSFCTLVLRFDANHSVSMYGGTSNTELKRIKISGEDVQTLSDYLQMKSPCALGNFILGYGTYPSTGYLGSGTIANVRFWARNLTDRECECVDTLQNEMYEMKPDGIPVGVKYDYFALNGNMYGTDEEGKIAATEKYDISVSNWDYSLARTRLPLTAMQSDGDGRLQFKDFGALFDAGYVANNGYSFDSSKSPYRYQSADHYRYPFPSRPGCNEDATYNFWLKVDELPAGEVPLFERYISDPDLYEAADNDNRPEDDRITWRSDDLVLGGITNNFSLKVSVTSTGYIKVEQVQAVPLRYTRAYRLGWQPFYKLYEGRSNPIVMTGAKITEGNWFMLTLVGKSEKSITVYLNGLEIGSIDSAMWFCSLPPTDLRFMWMYSDGTMHSRHGDLVQHHYGFSIGGWKGDIDDFAFYNKAFSAKEIKALYDAGVVDDYVYHTVTQGVVEPTLSIDSAYMSKGGGSTNVSLAVAKGVNWTATASASWLSIVGDKSGTGPADFTIKVAANPTVVHRVGTVTIAGKTVTITQEGLACEVIYSNPTFSVEGDVGSITVNPEGGGSWTATTDDDWIYIVFGESGTGSGEVMFITEQYLDTTSSRTGIITIGEEKVYITQRGYQLSIEPMVAEIGGNAGAGRIGVAADPDSIWTAIAQEDWITIVTGGEGIGDGSILYTVTDNTTGQTRTGHIYISGQMYTITQTCTLKLTATVVGNGSVNGAGDYSQGKEVTLRAVPDAGNVFSHWSGDVVGNDDVTTVKMDSVKNVTATFIPEAAAQKLAEQKAAQGGFYTRDQIHALEMGNLVFDVDASGTARVGVQLMETSDLSNPNSWKPATLNGNPDVGQDGTVGMKVKAEGNAKFFKVVMPEQK